MFLKNRQKTPSAPRKKASFALFAPAALSLGLFAAGCMLPEDNTLSPPGGDPDDPGNPGGSGTAQSYLGYGYDVVKSSYVNRGDVKMSNPILDQKKMQKDGMLVSDAANTQDFQVSVGSSVKKFYSDRNASLGIDIGGGALFSGGFGFEFGVKINESRIDSNSYLRGRTYRYTRDEYITGRDAQILQEYLTDGFIADLGTRTAAQFLDKYGTHALVRYYKGGALEFNYAYYGASLTTDAQMKAALNASFSVIKGEAAVGANANSSELQNKSVFHYYTYGGKAIDALKLDELRNNYGDWLNSIESSADICGIGSFDNSLIPVWELAEAAGLSSKAAELESEFNIRAIAAGKALLVKKIRTNETTYITAGNNTYTFDSASVNSPAEIEVYALGAGGGGQGGGKKSGILDNFQGTGGSGGGGAAAYMKLAVEKPVSFSVVVGGGGSGGSYNDVGLGGSGESGDAGTSGGNTTVTWPSESITLTARGGLGGGGISKVVGGGTGGTYTLPTALETVLKGKGGDNGKDGDDGSLRSDIGTNGGKAGVINKNNTNNSSSLTSFGGGLGAVRQYGGVTQSGDRGGGGCGGYSNGYPSGYGKDGGIGEVRIIVRYYTEE